MTYLDIQYDSNSNDIIAVLDETPLWSAPFGMAILNTVRLAPSLVALDIGCGMGFPLCELAMRLGPDATAHGLNPWQAALQRAQQKIAVYGCTNIHLHQGVAEQMPFESNFFDLVVSNNGLNNVSDMRQALQECQRVCKPGAQLVFTMNLDTTMHELYTVLQSVLSDKGMEDAVRAMQQHIRSKRKPLADVETLLHETGFSIQQTVHDEFVWRYANGSALFNHFAIKVAFLGGWRSVVQPEQEQSVFAEVENRLNAIAQQQGEICLHIPFVVIDCTRL